MEKVITFRPLRLIKKNGKIAVASYMQWRKVRTADYSKFTLIIDDEYKLFQHHEHVYNHLGEQLFWFDYNPADIPVFTYSVLFDLDDIRSKHERYGIDWGNGGWVNYHARGMDCEGVPTFSHLTAEGIVNSGYKDLEQFKPLTVGMVVKYYGWFIYQCQNSYLQIGK